MENKEIDNILSIKNLHVSFKSHGKDLKVIRGITLDIKRGETFAIVGESGSGKSVFTKTFTGMLEKNGKVKNGSIMFNGVKLRDPRIVKMDFKDEDYREKLLVKMEARSAHGLAKADLASLQSKYEKEKAKLDKELAQLTDVEYLVEQGTKKINKKFVKDNEYYSLKYAYVLNKLYNVSSTIEVKKQKEIDKIAKKMSSVLLGSDDTYSEKVIDDLRSYWDECDSETKVQLDSAREAGSMFEHEYEAASSIEEKHDVLAKYKNVAKNINSLSLAHMRNALGNLSFKISKIKPKENKGPYSLLTTIYAEALNSISSDIELAFKLMKLKNKLEIERTIAEKNATIQHLQEEYDNNIAKIRKASEEIVAKNSDKKVEEIKAAFEEKYSKEFEACKENNDKRTQTMVSENESYLASLDGLSDDEKKKYFDYDKKDIALLNKKVVELKELEKTKEETVAELSQYLSETLEQFKKEGFTSQVLDKANRCGNSIATFANIYNKQTEEISKLEKEYKNKVSKLSDSEKDQKRLQLIETETKGKIANCNAVKESIYKECLAYLSSAHFENSKFIIKLNRKIHYAECLLSKSRVLFHFFRLISLRDVTISLKKREIMVGDNCNLAKLETNREWSIIRGSHIATIFQDPMTSLNPLLTIGTQISEVLRLHHNLSRHEAKEQAIELLKKVKIPEAEKRYSDYPFQYSGGMRQRVVIAIALACRPDILICDEPTTALDVTVQAQILALIKELQQEYGFTIIFITHDLGVVAGVADRIGVMYGGQIVEYGTDEDIFYRPAHPYTWALLSSLPQLAVDNEPLTYIRGNPPSFGEEILGDSFAPRSEYAMKIDYMMEPPMFKISDTHFAKTWLLDERAPKIKKPVLIRNLEERMKKTADSFLSSSQGGEPNA